MSGSSAFLPFTPPPPPAAAPLCLLTQFTVAIYPFPPPLALLPHPVAAFGYAFLIYSPLFLTFCSFGIRNASTGRTKGDRNKRECGKWYGLVCRRRGGRGEVGSSGQLHLPTLCACTLHMAQRRRRPVAVCMEFFLLRFHISV